MPPRPDTAGGVRTLLPSDLGQVERILRGWAAFLPGEIDRALEVCGEAAAHPFQEFYGYGIKEGTRLYGFIVFGTTPLADRGWDLYWIGVKQNVARQGIGRRLCMAMEGVIRDQDGRQLHVETSSSPTLAPARRFYEATGFVLAARLPHYFRAGVDKLLYIKEGLAARRPPDNTGPILG